VQTIEVEVVKEKETEPLSIMSSFWDTPDENENVSWGSWGDNDREISDSINSSKELQTQLNTDITGLKNNVKLLIDFHDTCQKLISTSNSSPIWGNLLPKIQQAIENDKSIRESTIGCGRSLKRLSEVLLKISENIKSKKEMKLTIIKEQLRGEVDGVKNNSKNVQMVKSSLIQCFSDNAGDFLSVVGPEYLRSVEEAQHEKLELEKKLSSIILEQQSIKNEMNTTEIVITHIKRKVLETQTFHPKHPHLLECRPGRDPSGPYVSGFWCNLCNLTSARRWCCYSCQWDICESCFFREEPPVLHSIHPHPLYKKPGHDSSGPYLFGFSCNICRRSSEIRWCCMGCQFDLCEACYSDKIVHPLEMEMTQKRIQLDVKLHIHQQDQLNISQKLEQQSRIVQKLVQQSHEIEREFGIAGPQLLDCLVRVKKITQLWKDESCFLFPVCASMDAITGFTAIPLKLMLHSQSRESDFYAGHALLSNSQKMVYDFGNDLEGIGGSLRF